MVQDMGGGAAKSKLAKHLVGARVFVQLSRYWIVPMPKKSGNPYVTASLAFVIRLIRLIRLIRSQLVSTCLGTSSPEAKDGRTWRERGEAAWDG
jgi:hypothetical protein